MSTDIGSIGGDADMIDELIDQQSETAELLLNTRITLKKAMHSIVLLQSKIIKLEASVALIQEQNDVVPMSLIPSDLFRKFDGVGSNPVAVPSLSRAPSGVPLIVTTDDGERLVEGPDGVFRNPESMESQFQFPRM